MIKHIIKRIFDIILAAVLLVITSPILLLISLIVFVETKKSPIFIQERGLTLNKYRFKIYKFRTFYKDTTDPHLNQSSILKKTFDESLISCFGKLLRIKGLDELPQLINILKGDMSFVGPRPLSIEDLEEIKKYYPELYEERESLDLLPGLTGLWQLSRDDSFSIESLINLDNQYKVKQSFLYDLLLLTKSLRVVLFAKRNDAIIKTIPRALDSVIYPVLTITYFVLTIIFILAIIINSS